MAGPPARRWRPSPDDELLLTVALHADDRGTAAWARLRPRLDLDHLRVDQLALAPAVHHTLEVTGADDPDIGRLAGVRRKGWVHATRLLAAAAPTLAALAEAGVPTLALRGTALVAAGLLAPDRRPLRAVEVAVPAADLPAAVGLARGVGVEGPDLLDPATTAGLVAWPGTVAGDQQLALHWLVDPALPTGGAARSATAPPWTAGLEREPAWGRSGPATVGTAPSAVPDPADLLLQVALHEVGTGNADHLRWVLDVAAVLTAGPDWSLVVDEARHRRVARLLGRRLGYVATRFELPVPGEALGTLARSDDGARATVARAFVGGGPRRRALARYLLLTAADPPWDAIRALPAYRRAATRRRSM